jgi:hypothetical protein
MICSNRLLEIRAPSSIILVAMPSRVGESSLIVFSAVIEASNFAFMDSKNMTIANSVDTLRVQSVKSIEEGCVLVHILPHVTVLISHVV